MKKYLLIAMAIMAILGCTSCAKEEDPTCPPPVESKVVDCEVSYDLWRALERNCSGMLTHRGGKFYSFETNASI